MNLEEWILKQGDAELEFIEKELLTRTDKEIEVLIKEYSTEAEQLDSLQYALKIMLNSIYGTQIMRFFRYSDEWQCLGSSTTLTGRILTKYGLLEPIETFFNPTREPRYEFPLMDNIIVQCDPDQIFKDPKNQKLRHSIISDTDSVSGDTMIRSSKGDMTIEELFLGADYYQFEGDKEFAHFNNTVYCANQPSIKGERVVHDDIEFVYRHKIPSTKDMYEIELEDGTILKVTDDHSMMTYNEFGRLVECKASQIRVGDTMMKMVRKED